jgi:hypothetical protein
MNLRQGAFEGVAFRELLPILDELDEWELGEVFARCSCGRSECAVRREFANRGGRFAQWWNGPTPRRNRHGFALCYIVVFYVTFSI